MSEEPTKLDISDEMIAERRGDSSKMPNDMPRWMASLIVNIDYNKADHLLDPLYFFK